MKQLRILIIHSNTSMQSFLKDYAKRLGCGAVFLMGNGEQALKFLLSCQNVDLVITEHRMPGLGGEMLARTIKDNPLTANTKVFMLVDEAPAVLEVMSRVARTAGVDEIIETLGIVVGLPNALHKHFPLNFPSL